MVDPPFYEKRSCAETDPLPRSPGCLLSYEQKSLGRPLRTQAYCILSSITSNQVIPIAFPDGLIEGSPLRTAREFPAVIYYFLIVPLPASWQIPLFVLFGQDGARSGHKMSPFLRHIDLL